MLISSSNPYSALGQTYWPNNNVAPTNSSQSASDLPAVEAVAPIEKPNFEYNDINDINYERVNEFANSQATQPDSHNAQQAAPAEQSASPQQATTTPSEEQENNQTQETSQTAEPNSTEETTPNNETLSDEEKVVLNKLKTVDSNVRQHEQAHLTVAGGIASSGASYTYQIGPDGKQYAVGGEVNIDTSSESTPEATIQKMNQVIAAAMAPADPSSQDFSVASAARRVIAEMGKMQTQQNQAESQPQNTTEANTNTTQTTTNAEQVTPINNNSTPPPPATQNSTTTTTSSNIVNNSNNSRQPAYQQQPTIEEPISILSAQALATRQIELYKQNNLNSSNNLATSNINIIVA